MRDDTQEPGPGPSRAAAGWGELRKEIGQRNEQAHQNARKLLAKERERLTDERERIAAEREWVRRGPSRPRGSGGGDDA